MKNIYILIYACLFILHAAVAQIPHDSLDINNIRANIYPDDYLFDSDFDNGFEAPKGSGKSTIDISHMWIGGVDAGNGLRIAAATYRQYGPDFYPGPLDTTTISIDSTEIANYKHVWKINKTAIDSFIAYYYNGVAFPGGYTIPLNILTWPGNGDSARNEAHLLAPFYDNNNDGIYNPYDGDFPCIKGDQALFYIFNDEGGLHYSSHTAPLGVEVHAMVYGFKNSHDTALYNTVFVNYQIFNRSSSSFLNAWIGNWTDFTIGNWYDNYIGCDVSRDFYYGYNGDSLDEGSSGYGLHPPAQGVVFLKGPLADPNDGIDNNRNGIVDEPGETIAFSNFMYNNSDFSALGWPFSASDFYDYMKAIWKDGQYATYGADGHQAGNAACNFVYPETTDPAFPMTDWTETTAGNVPGYRIGTGSWGHFTLSAGQVQCIDYAYVFSRDTTKDNLGNVTILKQRVDSVRSFYNNHPELQTCACTAMNVAVNNINAPANSFTIYPNPANNRLTIHTSFKGKATATILNVLGQETSPPAPLQLERGEALIDVSKLPAGIYFLQLKGESGSVVRKFVKE